MPKINLKESIDKLDRKTFCKDDLLNMYYCCNFSDKEKAILAEMFSKNNTRGVTRFIKEAYKKRYDGIEMICNPSPAAFNASMGEEVEDNFDDNTKENKKVKRTYSFLTNDFTWQIIDAVNERLGLDEKRGVARDFVHYNSRSGQYELVLFLHGRARYETTIDEEDRKEAESEEYLFNKYGKDMVEYFVGKLEKYNDRFSKRRYSHKLSDGRRVYYTKTADGERVLDNSDFKESYGGAFDIEENQYFTREDLDEFLDYVIEEIERSIDVEDVVEVYNADIDDNILDITLSLEGYEEQYKTRIDMRRIRVPNDLVRRYADEVIEYFTNKFQEAIDNKDIILDESGAGTAVASAASGFGSAVGNRIMDKILPEDVNDLERRVITISNGKKFRVNIKNSGSIDFTADVEMIRPYDDAHYIWARIEADKRVWFIRNGIVLERTNAYKVSFWPDDYETTDEYINDFIYDVAEDLVEMNSDTEERICRS